MKLPYNCALFAFILGRVKSHSHRCWSWVQSNINWNMKIFFWALIKQHSAVFCAISRSIFWMSAIFIFLLKNLMVLIALILEPKRSILLGIWNANRLCTKMLTVKNGDWPEGASLSISDDKACTTRVNRHCLWDSCVIQFRKLTYFLRVNLKIL